MGETRVAMEPSYNGSSSDALTCDWEYDVWLFWPSTSSLQSLPRVDDEGRFERKALEAWKSQNSGTNQQSERVDPLHCTGHHTIDAHDVHAASRDMGAMGYSRIFRSGLVAKVEPPSAVSLRSRVAGFFPNLSSTLTDLSKTLTIHSRN